MYKCTPPSFKHLLGWGGLLLLSLALAAKGIGIAPPRYEFLLAPGERKTEVFHIFTTEQQAQNVQIELIDYTQTSDGNYVFLPAGSIPYSLAPYLTVALDPFEVTADAEKKISFTVVAPPNGEGSYWVAIAFTTQQARQEKVKGIRVTQQVRVLGAIYVTVKGTERPDAALEAAKVEDNKLTAFLANKGNTYLRFQPTIILKNAQGNTIYQSKKDPILLLRDARIKLSYSLPEDKLKEAVLVALELKPIPPIMLPSSLYIEAELP